MPKVMRNYTLIISLAFLGMIGCKPKENIVKYTPQDAEYLHQCEKKLTDIIVIDIFSPPVSSRVYAYPLIAAYEAARHAQKDSKSLMAQLKGFEGGPSVLEGQNYDFTLAAITAFCETAHKVVFSKKEIKAFQEELTQKLSNRNENDVNERSIAFGKAIAEVAGKRIGSDNYKETRGMERYEVQTGRGLWVPTLPDYADAVEPHWGKMKNFVLDSAAQCKPMPPTSYSEDKNSAFWKELLEVYETVNKITPEQDQITIFWDDNPFVSRHKGHLMFQDKKMTPGGHWLAITQLICKEKKTDFVTTAKIYALTSVGLFEAFLSCWDEKYRSLRVRPETVIKDNVDKNWKPYLVTPPFPAYTSGHSSISAAAAEILTAQFGDNINYTDTTEKEYGLPVRSFKSFREAALQASISRVYGGIHFKSDCAAGNRQGIEVGKIVLAKIRL
jgi:PAP2 superfamily